MAVQTRSMTRKAAAQAKEWAEKMKKMKMERCLRVRKARQAYIALEEKEDAKYRNQRRRDMLELLKKGISLDVAAIMTRS